MSECQILSNPDVSGIGISRLNELRESLFFTAGLNGFALLLTAVIQTAYHTLDLYHAIVVIHQLTFLGVTTVPSSNYRASLFGIVYHITTTLATRILLASWSMYVWITAPTFGASLFASGDSHCNDSVKYVVFFVTIRATVPWARWLSVAGASTFSIGLFTRHIFYRPIKAGSEDVDLLRPSPMVIAFVTRFGFVYSIIMLELTIARNNVAAGETVWSFGQIIPVVISGSAAIDVILFFLGGEGDEDE
ncbi:hypothetical protein DL93DRAFT_857345 [Clavulina sp. PMI_390]|nr:hypothetical protein DL93DRAFT_857345 [Clavulina sp. PMI_390]